MNQAPFYLTFTILVIIKIFGLIHVQTSHVYFDFEKACTTHTDVENKILGSYIKMDIQLLSNTIKGQHNIS